VPAYTINARSRKGPQLVTAGTADSAMAALNMYRAASRLWPQLFISDEDGDINEAELERRALEERKNA